MRNLAILLTICTLSGCGLFKKSSKEIEKHSTEIEQSIEKQTNIDYQDKSKSVEVNTSVTHEASINGYTVKADVIKFNPDGSFEAKGNVNMKGNNNWQKQQKDSTSNQVQADKILKENIKEKIKQKEEVKDYSKQTKSETDFLGIIAGALGILIIVIGVIWNLKR